MPGVLCLWVWFKVVVVVWLTVIAGGCYGMSVILCCMGLASLGVWGVGCSLFVSLVVLLRIWV